jgi:hypothetical protein
MRPIGIAEAGDVVNVAAGTLLDVTRTVKTWNLEASQHAVRVLTRRVSSERRLHLVGQALLFEVR